MKPRIDAKDNVEWWLANNYGPHVNQQAWEWIQQLRAKIARLTPLETDAAISNRGDGPEQTAAPLKPGR